METTAMVNQNLEIETATIKNGLKIYRAANSELRQKMLNLIHKNGRTTVTKIFQELDIEQPVASNHLAILRSAGLVMAKRVGKNVFYSINYSRLDFLHHKSNDLLVLLK